MSLVVSGGTVIDGISDDPAEGQSILIEGGRIKAVGRPAELRLPPDTRVMDARGKYVIPGLMNANVHLFGLQHLEIIARYLGRYEDLIAEAAQVALKNGLTTVFDTWGPRRPLMAVRDRIAAGEIPGSRMFCAGNILGFDSPFSPDFSVKAVEVASADLARRVNAIWVENVGRRLMWLTPPQLANEVRVYVDKGIDFVKYASNDHFPGAFLAFSQEAQAAIVDVAHRAGVTAQAHAMSVEGLRLAVEAACDIIQHANHTGPVPIPETTLELISRRGTGAVVFPMTQQRLDWFTKNESYRTPEMWLVADANARNIIRSGATILLGNDGLIPSPQAMSDSSFTRNWGGPWQGNLFSLASGHFTWFEAMEEKGCSPMKMLKAATRNIAVAYGKDKDLGTIEAGKIADLLILDEDPMRSAKAYRSIHAILKEGAIVDRDALPLDPILTKPLDPPEEEEASFVSFLRGGALPLCLCMSR